MQPPTKSLDLRLVNLIAFALIAECCLSVAAFSAIVNNAGSICITKKYCIHIAQTPTLPFVKAIPFILACLSGGTLLGLMRRTAPKASRGLEETLLYANATIGVLWLGFAVLSLRGASGFALANAVLAVAVAVLSNIAKERSAVLQVAVSRFGLASVLGLSVLCGVAFGKKGRPERPNSGILASDAMSHLDKQGEATYGSKSAETEIIVFSDPVCPACMANVPGVITKVSGSQGKFRLTYRQFPLPIHPQAHDLALLEIWASSHGSFDKFRGLIEKDKGTQKKIVEDLPSIGLDSNEAKKIVEGKSAEAVRCADTLAADVADARAIGVSGTPCFIVRAKNTPVKWYLGYPRIEGL